MKVSGLGDENQALYQEMARYRQEILDDKTVSVHAKLASLCLNRRNMSSSKMTLLALLTFVV